MSIAETKAYVEALKAEHEKMLAWENERHKLEAMESGGIDEACGAGRGDDAGRSQHHQGEVRTDSSESRGGEAVGPVSEEAVWVGEAER